MSLYTLMSLLMQSFLLMTVFYRSILSLCSVSQSFSPHILMSPVCGDLRASLEQWSSSHLMLPLPLLSHTHGPSHPDRYCECCNPLKPCQHRACFCRVSVKSAYLHHYELGDVSNVSVCYIILTCFFWSNMFLRIIFWSFVSNDAAFKKGSLSIVLRAIFYG